VFQIPPSAAQIASAVPSPPSAIGIKSKVASGQTPRCRGRSPLPRRAQSASLELVGSDEDAWRHVVLRRNGGLEPVESTGCTTRTVSRMITNAITWNVLAIANTGRSRFQIVEHPADDLSPDHTAHRAAETNQAGDRTNRASREKIRRQIITSVDQDCCPK